MQGHQELSEAEDVGRDQVRLREISLPSLTLAKQKMSPAF